MLPNGAPALHGGLLYGPGLFVPDADVQIFVPEICAQVLAANSTGVDFQGAWAKPPGTRFSWVFACGGGGGGSGGGYNSGSTSQAGGPGGASGNVSQGFFLSDGLPAEVPVYVGAGGAGGPQVAISGSGNQSAGTAANPVIFGALSVTSPGVILAAGGGSGPAGSGTTGGTPATTGLTFLGRSGSGSTSGAPGTDASGGSMGVCGGASGGGATSAAGFAGGSSFLSTSGQAVAGAGAIGAAGSNGINSLIQAALGLTTPYLPAGTFIPLDLKYVSVGAGGAGGGGAHNAAGAAGGNGCYGGGGGGGGADVGTGGHSGAGGNGGDGFLIVVSW